MRGIDDPINNFIIERRGFSVREISVGRVQQNVTAFVEKCLLRELRKRIDGELSSTGLCGQVSYMAQSDLALRIIVPSIFYAT